MQIRVAEFLAVALPRDGQRAEQLPLHLDRHLQRASGGRPAPGGGAVGDRTAEPVGVLVVEAEGGVARAGEGGGGLGETAQRTAQIMVGADRHHGLQELRKPGDRPAGQLAQALRGAFGELSRRIRRLQGTPLTFGRFEQSNSPERVLLGCPRAGGPGEGSGRGPGGGRRADHLVSGAGHLGAGPEWIAPGTGRRGGVLRGQRRAPSGRLTDDAIEAVVASARAPEVGPLVAYLGHARKGRL